MTELTTTPRIVITGASGQLARRTAQLLAERCGAERLIFVTRNPDALDDLSSEGAEVRFGDFDEPDSLGEAFSGGDRMLLISATDLERRTEQHRAALQAAAAAGVRYVVYTSCLSPEAPNPAVIAPSHHATEQALRESGLAWTVLRNSFYAEYQAAEAAEAAASGKLVHNRGDGRIAYVSREDCAAAAAAVLAGAGHEGRVYDVTGPEALDATDLAGIYAELHGRPVEVVHVDDDGLVARLAGDDEGHLRYGAEFVASLGRSIREGFMASCSDAVTRLTGRAPRTLREVLLSS